MCLYCVNKAKSKCSLRNHARSSRLVFVRGILHGIISDFMICLGYLTQQHKNTHLFQRIFWILAAFSVFVLFFHHKTSFISTSDKLLRIFFCLEECLGDTALVASPGDAGRIRFVLLLAELDEREMSLASALLLSVASSATLMALMSE